MTKVYAVAESVPESTPYIVAGKRYEVIREVAPLLFHIKDEIGRERACLWESDHGCAHLEGGNWTRIEEDEMIDWAKPLELMDGTPVELEPHKPTEDAGYTNSPDGGPDEDGDYWVSNVFIPGEAWCISANGNYGEEQFVRNRA